jgi:hypothetical protein
VVDKAAPFVRWFSLTFPFSFVSLVLQSFCIQTGNLTLVVLDSLLDIVLFVGLALAWARPAPADDVVLRLGVSGFIVIFFKFLMCVCGFGCG